MTQLPYDVTEASAAPTGDGPGVAADAPALERWQGFLFAAASLALVFGLGCGVSIAGGSVVHVLQPSKHLNDFAAFHNAWIDGVLLGIAVLWLVPPYPWAKRAIAPLPRE